MMQDVDSGKQILNQISSEVYKRCGRAAPASTITLFKQDKYMIDSFFRFMNKVDIHSPQLLLNKL